jgi:hypothetical protein
LTLSAWRTPSSHATLCSISSTFSKLLIAHITSRISDLFLHYENHANYPF